MNEPAIQVLQLAAAWASRSWLIELAGGFWLLAEAAILGCVVYCRAWLARAEGTKVRVRIALMPAAIAVAVSLTALALILRDRSDYSASLALAQPDVTPEILETARLAEVQAHLQVWSIFVIFWVLLEGLIVLQGWRLYRQLIAHVQD